MTVPANELLNNLAAQEELFKEAIQKSIQFFQGGNLEVAEEILSQLLRCVPDHPDGVQILGLIHHKKHNYPKALELFQKAIQIDPQNSDNFNNLALAQSCTGDTMGAIQSLNKAIDLAPPDQPQKKIQYISNLALQYRQLGELEYALDLLNEAVYLSGQKEINALLNLGAVYGEMREIKDATIVYEEAVKLDPTNAQAHVDLAYSYHLVGRMAEAWEHYEWRYECFPQLNLLNLRYPKETRWKKGESLADKKLLLFCEQGLGDALHFVRYVSLVKWLHPTCKIIMQCSPALKPLFETSDLGIDEFFCEPIFSPSGLFVPPEHDVHASVLSLPYLTQIDEWKEQMKPDLEKLKNIPYEMPWDSPDWPPPYLKTHEKADLGEKKEFRIGICWAGSPQHPNDSRRSCHLRLFKGLHDLPGVKLYSFQQDKRPRMYRYNTTPIDFCEGTQDMKVVDMSEFMTDFAKTAALLQEMDLIITVDTALLHLAAAIGVETWGLIPFNPDWRWGLEGNTSNLYNKLTLFRQEKVNDWTSVFAAIETSLKERLSP